MVCWRSVDSICSIKGSLSWEMRCVVMLAIGDRFPWYCVNRNEDNAKRVAWIPRDLAGDMQVFKMTKTGIENWAQNFSCTWAWWCGLHVPILAEDSALKTLAVPFETPDEADRCVIMNGRHWYTTTSSRRFLVNVYLTLATIYLFIHVCRFSSVDGPCKTLRYGRNKNFCRLLHVISLLLLGLTYPWICVWNHESKWRRSIVVKSPEPN